MEPQPLTVGIESNGARVQWAYRPGREAEKLEAAQAFLAVLHALESPDTLTQWTALAAVERLQEVARQVYPRP